jgi:hypothetical protein
MWKKSHMSSSPVQSLDQRGNMDEVESRKIQREKKPKVALKYHT